MTDRFDFGAVTVYVAHGRTTTVLPDGRTVQADHAEQPGQAERARELGFKSAEEMNRSHDLTHSILAHVLGLPCSPTLYGLAEGTHFPHWRIEEAAVLAVQQLAAAAGVDLFAVARRMGREP